MMNSLNAVSMATQRAFEPETVPADKLQSFDEHQASKADEALAHGARSQQHLRIAGRAAG